MSMRGKMMSINSRFKNAWILTCIAIFSLTIINAIFQLDLEDILISPKLVIPLFITSYFLVSFFKKKE